MAYGYSDAPFSPHWSTARVQRGVVDRRVFIGRFYVPHRYNAEKAYVKNDVYFPSDISIKGKESKNRALHGDIVAVTITEWAPNEPTVDSDPNACEKTPCFADKSQIENARSKYISDELKKVCGQYGMPVARDWKENMLPMGRIVAILHQELHLVAGKVMPLPDVRISRVRFMKLAPSNSRYPLIKLSNTAANAPFLQNHDDVILVKCLTWDENDISPNGSCIESLGRATSLHAQARSIFIGHGIAFPEFGENVIRSLPNAQKVIDTSHPGRKDLRESEFPLTIDPATAEDLDDALSIRKLENGNFLVGVHIADVASIVQEGSIVDLEARRRSTAYRIEKDKVYMLPEQIRNACSLTANTEKLAISIMWEVSESGDVRFETEWLGPSVIQSRCQLSYGTAQDILDGKESKSGDFLKGISDEGFQKTVESVRNLWKIAQKIRSQRLAKGALSIDTRDIEFSTQNALPNAFIRVERTESRFLVEELMTLANHRVALKLRSVFPDAALVRTQDLPDAQKLRLLKNTLAKSNVSLDIETPEAFSKCVLELQADKKLEPFVDGFLRRSMGKGGYVLTAAGEASYPHYMLGIDIYTHFSSPIRRYPDLYVHRLLWILFNAEDKGIIDSLKDFKAPPLDLSRMNEAHRNDRNIFKLGRELYLCLLSKNKTAQKSFPACIVQMMKQRPAIVVYIPEIITYVDIMTGTRDQMWVSAEITDDEMTLKMKWPKSLGSRKETEAENLDTMLQGMSIAGMGAYEAQDVVLLEPLRVTLFADDKFPMKLHALIHPPSMCDKEIPVGIMRSFLSP